ncbi:MAG: redox-regulated ATPase YchF [Candidatus Margulisbacteria bacterium]|nr:redox-regulated ATPase YchF [Candidatus Margulisiibacteriota bacterium]
MSFSLGIVGLPNVGKSSLFNALSRAQANVSNYPFCTIDPNIGVVEVPDERLQTLAKMFSSKKIVPAVIEFYDIAGLVKGASRGEGLGNKFLANIREVDAILHVVRCFKSEEIVHVEGEVNPRRDIGIINLELSLADLSQVEKRLIYIKPKVKNGDPKALKEQEFLQKMNDWLATGKLARNFPFEEKDKEFVKEISLLTIKPVLFAANVDESGNKGQVEVVRAVAAEEEAQVVVISSKLEAELAELSLEDAQAYLAALGVKETALAKLIRAGYELLNLITFFTAGEKDSHAWTVTKGAKAPQAAGKIHSDMEKGFIAAEVVHYQDFIAAGTMAKAKEQGLIQTEGKQYVVEDGDLILVRFAI